jgi:hypothetical protein
MRRVRLTVRATTVPATRHEPAPATLGGGPVPAAGDGSGVADAGSWLDSLIILSVAAGANMLARYPDLATAAG